MAEDRMVFESGVERVERVERASERPAERGRAGQPAGAASLTPQKTGQGAQNAGQSGPNQRRRRRRRGGNTQGQQLRPGQVTNTTAVPVVAAPQKRGAPKRPLADPRIAVGCIVIRGEEILLVRERGRWSLPKGGLEAGELVQDGARRETFEETGIVVELRDLAFIVEFQAQSWGHHLQFFYTGREVGGNLAPRDPDRDVQEARFVPIRQLREFIRFRPRLVALETWLRERRPRHFVFNLDKEPAMLRKRRRVGDPLPAAAIAVAEEHDLSGEPDL